jgi:hypothetical protein
LVEQIAASWVIADGIAAAAAHAPLQDRKSSLQTA